MYSLWIKLVLVIVVVLLFSFTLITSLLTFSFSSSLDKYSKVELFLYLTSYLAASNAVVLQGILRYFLFSIFTASVSCLHNLIFLINATVLFNIKLLCQYLFLSCFVVNLYFFIHPTYLGRYISVLLLLLFL